LVQVEETLHQDRRVATIVNLVIVAMMVAMMEEIDHSKI